jgi:osmotically-inducible protein OsmY
MKVRRVRPAFACVKLVLESQGDSVIDNRRRHSMRKMAGLTLLVGAIAIAISTSAWAQSGSAPSAGAAASGNGAAASVASAPVSGRKANRALRRKVYAAIGKHKEISAGNIGVTAKDGAVTLNGTVSDASQIATVAEIAKGVPGVMSVTNKLTVQKPFGAQ